jgi:hypothetical protein
MNKPTTLAALICAAFLLTACGGGGSDGGTATPSSTDTTSATAAAATESTIDSLVVPVTLNWDSGRQNALTLRVVDASTGAPIADANITLFSVSRTAPNSDVPLDVPMPVAEIDSASSDAAGNATLTARIPAHLEEVLLVASSGTGFVRQVVQPQAVAQTLELRISR